VIGLDNALRTAASLADDELLVCMDSVMYSGEHIFFRADKMALGILFADAAGEAWLCRMLPWRSTGRPHRQVYADAGLVRVDKGADSKLHGRVVPEGLASGAPSTPAAFCLRLRDIETWPYTSSPLVPDMRRSIERFDGREAEWSGLPHLLLSCREGAHDLLDCETHRRWRGSPETVHDGRAYYDFSRCYGRGVLAATGHNHGSWMRVSTSSLSGCGGGYSISLPTIHNLKGLR
jgi:hypothetical protein